MLSFKHEQTGLVVSEEEFEALPLDEKHEYVVIDAVKEHAEVCAMTRQAYTLRMSLERGMMRRCERCGLEVEFGE